MIQNLTLLDINMPQLLLIYERRMYIDIEIFCSCDCFHLVTHFQKLKFFLFFETASLYLVYCLLIVYARCRFQKHKIFYFLKVETMDSKFHKKEQFPANIWLKKHILPSRGMFFL